MSRTQLEAIKWVVDHRRWTLGKLKQGGDSLSFFRHYQHVYDLYLRDLDTLILFWFWFSEEFYDFFFLSQAATSFRPHRIVDWHNHHRCRRRRRLHHWDDNELKLMEKRNRPDDATRHRWPKSAAVGWAVFKCCVHTHREKWPLRYSLPAGWCFISQSCARHYLLKSIWELKMCLNMLAKRSRLMWVRCLSVCGLYTSFWVICWGVCVFCKAVLRDTHTHEHVVDMMHFGYYW